MPFELTVGTIASLAEEKTRLPTDTVGRSSKLLERAVLDLPHPFFADAEQVADLAKAVRAVAGESEAKVEDLAFTGAEVFHQEMQRLLAFGDLAQVAAFVIRHGLGELEIAVVVQDRVEGDRGSRGGLKVS